MKTIIFGMMMVGWMVITGQSMVLAEEVIPVQATFSNKIVYTSDAGFNQDVLIKDCQKRGGVFNECGSACDDQIKNMGCIAVCALTCELNHKNLDDNKRGQLKNPKIENQYVVRPFQIAMERTRRAKYDFSFYVESPKTDKFNMISLRLYTSNGVERLFNEFEVKWDTQSKAINQVAKVFRKDMRYHLYMKETDNHCQNIVLESENKEFHWMYDSMPCPKISYLTTQDKDE